MKIPGKINGGDVLFATLKLESSYFERALILIVDNNRDGIFGVILNRPSHMPLSELFTVDSDLSSVKRTIFSGGPMDEDMVLTLKIHKNAQTFTDGLAVSDLVEYGSHWHSIDDLLTSQEDEVYIYLGYAGWREQQLADEIKEGSWFLFRNINTKELLQEWFTPPFTEHKDILEYLKKKDASQ